MNKKELISKYDSIKPAIKKHLSSFSGKNESEMYKEFIFCLLTPQSNARKCWHAVELIESSKARTHDQISSILKGKSRFHNTKAARVMQAKEKWNEVKKLLDTEIDVITLRNKIADSVNGYGLKEASHFLRNIGVSDSKIAILDRHIMRNLASLGAIKESSKMSKSIYLGMERDSLKFASEIGIPIDELDILFWHNEHGEFFK